MPDGSQPRLVAQNRRVIGPRQECSERRRHGAPGGQRRPGAIAEEKRHSSRTVVSAARLATLLRVTDVTDPRSFGVRRQSAATTALLVSFELIWKRPAQSYGRIMQSGVALRFHRFPPHSKILAAPILRSAAL